MSSRPPSSEAPLEWFGDYEIIREVGRGAMGVVYQARHQSLRRMVALKMLLAGELASEKEIGRFEIEARAAARLDHPNIVKVYDVGQHAGRRFLAMQFVDGRSLADATRSGGMPERSAAKLVRDVALAIAYAHRQGILHRDLKPANILLDADDSPHVTDFGLAKHLVHPDYTLAAMTQSGAALGTPSYMPPEQAAGQSERIRETADVYGLGAILYELLTGYVPFLRPTPAETVMQVLQEDVFPPRRLNRTLDRDLETICLRCLEKSPANRYQTADGVANDLQRFLDDRPIKARPVSMLTQAWRWCRRNRTVAVSMATAMSFLIVLAAIGVGIGLYQQSMREEIADRLYVSNMEVAQSSLESSNLSRTLEILKLHRNDSRRGFEWYYLWERCRESLLCPTLEHESAVWGVACSPDGKRIATGTIRGQLTLWDVEAWKKIQSVNCGNRVTAVAFSPDGSLVAAACGDGDLRLWSIAANQVRRLAAHRDKAWAVAFSPNGRMLASADSSGEVLIWDVETWRPKTLPSSHVADVWGVAFSPDSTQLVTGGSAGAVVRWDVAKGEATRMPDSAGSVRSVAISPDGRHFAAGHADGSISLWDAKANKVTNHPVHEATIWSLQFTDDGTKIAFGSGNGAIGLVDVASGRVARAFLGHESSIFSISMLDDGRLATAGSDQRVKVWDLRGDHRPRTLIGHTDPVTSVAIRGESLASAGQDGKVIVWDLRTGEGTVLSKHSGPVWDVNFLRDGRLVSVGADRQIIVWNAQGQSSSSSIPDAHSGTIRFAVLSPDGSMMATGGDDEIVRIWSTESELTLLNELTGHLDDVQSATFIQTDSQLKLATGSDDQTVRLWDLSNKSSTVVLRHDSTVWAVAAEANGRFLVSGGMDGKVQAYFPLTGEKEVLQKRGLPVHAVLVPREGNVILSGGLDQAVTCWDASTRAFRAALRGHTGRVWGLAASDNEPLYASSSQDGTIRIWRAATKEEVANVGW